MIRLGIAFIILAVLAMLIPLLFPGLMSPFAPLYCQPGERLNGELSDDPAVQETTGALVYQCVNSDHQARLVTGSVVGSAVSAFVVLLILGVVVVIWGVARMDFDAVGTNKPS